MNAGVFSLKTLVSLEVVRPNGLSIRRGAAHDESPLASHEIVYASRFTIRRSYIGVEVVTGE